MKAEDTGLDFAQLAETHPYDFGLSRRSFAKLLGGGLMLAVSHHSGNAQESGQRSRGGFLGTGAHNLAARIHLGTDGTITGLFCAAKATGVLVGAGLVARALRRRAAALRHLVWGLGLAGALAVLPLALALPRWGVPVLEAPARDEPALVSSPAADVRLSGAPVVMETAMLPAEAPATPPAMLPVGPSMTEHQPGSRRRQLRSRNRG